MIELAVFHLAHSILMYCPSSLLYFSVILLFCSLHGFQEIHSCLTFFSYWLLLIPPIYQKKSTSCNYLLYSHYIQPLSCLASSLSLPLQIHLAFYYYLQILLTLKAFQSSFIMLESYFSNAINDIVYIFRCFMVFWEGYYTFNAWIILQLFWLLLSTPTFSIWYLFLCSCTNVKLHSLHSWYFFFCFR